MTYFYRKLAKATMLILGLSLAQLEPSLAIAAPLHETGGGFAAGKSSGKSKYAFIGKSSRQVVKTAPKAGKKSKFSPGRAIAPAAGYYRPDAVQKPRPYEKTIHYMAQKYHVPEDLIHAVVNTESGYNHLTRGGVGEIGLMQVRPATARLVGYTGSAKGLYDPAVNLEYGTRYLALAQNLSGGSLCGTVLKYNAGHGAKRMNPVSFRYCQKVKAYLYAVGHR